MYRDERIQEILAKLEFCDDDDQAVLAARELRELVHEKLERIRRAVVIANGLRTASAVWTIRLRDRKVAGASEREARTRI